MPTEPSLSGNIVLEMEPAEYGISAEVRERDLERCPQIPLVVDEEERRTRSSMGRNGCLEGRNTISFDGNSKGADQLLQAPVERLSHEGPIRLKFSIPVKWCFIKQRPW